MNRLQESLDLCLGRGITIHGIDHHLVCGPIVPCTA
jgi:hypothetical protein